jgi:hypothetical protein
MQDSIGLKMLWFPFDSITSLLPVRLPMLLLQLCGWFHFKQQPKQLQLLIEVAIHGNTCLT